MIDIKKLDFEKGDGLLPAIIQDADTFQILMLGYMNEEALKKTLEKERVTFYSRSKQRIWTKGETSDNYLELVDLQPDCDNDTLLIMAHPHGPTCHTGHQSCFFQKDFKPDDKFTFLRSLERLIASRKKEMPDGSYTTSLLEDGIDEMAQKVGEEAVETVIEAKNNDDNAFTGEVADLLYHLMVLLEAKEVPLQQIIKKLEERHQT